MVTLNVPKFVTLTLTLPSVVTLVSATVYVVPEPDKAPATTAPVPFVTVMSPIASPVTAWLNVSVMPVEFAVPLVPPVCAAVKVTLVSGTPDVSLYTSTVIGDPEILYPDGLLTDTDTVPSAVTSDKETDQFIPDPLSEPFIAAPVPSVIVM